ncbi:MAG: NifB/NifX family molybdenum-iron cluster-binding protein [Candidatus Bathyarchaeia archaeon]
MRETKLAIPTKGRGGMEDTVSDVFGRAKTFTIIDVEGKEIAKVEVIQNSAASYKHGAGPIVVKTLTDLGVNTVMASEFGPGVTTMLEHFNITKVEVNRGTQVVEAIKEFLESVVAF